MRNPRGKTSQLNHVAQITLPPGKRKTYTKMTIILYIFIFQPIEIVTYKTKGKKKKRTSAKEKEKGIAETKSNLKLRTGKNFCEKKLELKSLFIRFHRPYQFPYLVFFSKLSF